MGSTNSTSLSAKNFTDITQTMRSAVCQDNDASNTINDVEVSISNSACGNITVGKQSGQLNCESSFKTAAAIASRNLEQALNEAGVGSLKVPASLQQAGADVTSLQETSINTFVETMCGNNNTVRNVVENTTVRVDGVKCDDMQIFEQKASLNIVCSQQLFSQLVKENNLEPESPQKNWFFSFITTMWGIIVCGIAFLVVLIVIGYFLFKHRDHIKDPNQIRKYGGGRQQL